MVTPHDQGIIDEVNAVPLKDLPTFLAKDLGRIITLGRPADDAYLAVGMQAALDPSVFRRRKFTVVYTNIHGTGGVATVPLLAHAGVQLTHGALEVLGLPQGAVHRLALRFEGRGLLHHRVAQRLE